jgi:hypothetical protein
MQGCGRGLVLKVLPSICPEGLKKTKKKLNPDSWSSGQDLNVEPPEYEARVLTA